MRFKEFYNEELQGLFGKIKALNTGTLAHRVEKNSRKPDVAKKGTTVSRMMSGPDVTTTPRPAGITIPKKPMTIPTNFTDRSKQLTGKPKVKDIAAPIERKII